MAADGPAFYDDDAVFATYQARRRSADNPNDTMEGPTVAELVGDVRGLRILDLGCGAGSFGRELLDRGASAYVGVEGSSRMAAAARAELDGTAAVVVEENVETWSYPTSAFDVTVARLVLHYVAELAPLFDKVARTLAPGGRFIFSVEHPVITSCSRGSSEGGPRSDWLVDDYFVTGARVPSWLGGEVRKYHRTVEDYFAATQAAGLVEQLREARPRSERFADVDTYRRRTRLPLFLVLAAGKVAS